MASLLLLRAIYTRQLGQATPTKSISQDQSTRKNKVYSAPPSNSSRNRSKGSRGRGGSGAINSGDVHRSTSSKSFNASSHVGPGGGVWAETKSTVRFQMQYFAMLKITPPTHQNHRPLPGSDTISSKAQREQKVCIMGIPHRGQGKRSRSSSSSSSFQEDRLLLVT